MTPTDFEWRVRVARPGARILYHTGNLMHDRALRGDKTADAVNALARAAWVAMEAGKITLLQEIVPDGTAYLAVKLRHPHERVVWKGCYDPNRKNYVKPALEAAE